MKGRIPVKEMITHMDINLTTPFVLFVSKGTKRLTMFHSRVNYLWPFGEKLKDGGKYLEDTSN